MPLNKADVAAALGGGAFGWAVEKDAPCAILDPQTLTVLYAAPSFLNLLEARSPAAFQRLVTDSESPAARRLRRIAADPAPFAPARLEHLRFYVRGAPVALDLVTGRVPSPGGETWLVLSAPAREGGFALPPTDPTPAQQEPACEDGEPAFPAFEPPPLDGPVRFLWALDADGRFTSVGPELEPRLGLNAPREGEPLTELERRAGLGAGWSEAFAAGVTFSALRVEWPEPGGGRARVVKISGAPHFDSARAVLGFKGFGVFTGEGVESAPAEPRARIAPAPNPIVAEDSAPGSKFGAEIVMLRPGALAAASNVVSIRPGALNQLTSALEVSATSYGPGAVELTAKEREAFREIARALGAPKRDLTGPVEPAPAEPDTAGGAPKVRDLAALIDALPVGVLVVGDDGTLFANRALIDFAGYDSLQAFRADDGVRKVFNELDLQTLRDDEREVEVVAAGGSPALVLAFAVPLDWQGERSTLVTLRRSREAEHEMRATALRAEARRHAERAGEHLTAIDLASDGFVQLDASGRVSMMSAKAENLLGFQPGGATGSNFLSLLAPQTQPLALAAFLEVSGAAAGRGGKVVPDAQMRVVNGRSVSCRLTFGRFRGSDPVEAFFVIEEREGEDAEKRELAAARDAALRANERKTEFLALVSHEIRTPLQAILGFAEVMVQERFGPIGNERYKDYLRDIYASGRHVISLANDLIDLAKIEAGKLELVFEPVDVNQIIRDCVSLMQPQAARERILVRMSLSDDLPSVSADVRSLRQIMLNLISNAIKFNEPGGQVIISTAADEAGGAIIRVRDTGVGMSDGELALALEPFRRPEGGKFAEGAGLGLPLTKALVEANRADFLIKSRKEQGTLVEVAFAGVRAAQ